MSWELAGKDGLTDTFRRHINYLRVSVTDRCNLRCIYCMPSQGIPLMRHNDVLSYEEIETVVRVAAELGINKVRLTGGEPLSRKDLPRLIGMLSHIEGINEVSLTTNGTLLKEQALELKRAGLRRLNVSLDTLKPDRFRYITRCGELQDALDGIQAAKNAGLHPVKINMVVMRGTNDGEVLDFAIKTRDDGWHVRFIELMPLSEITEFVPSAEIRHRLASLGTLEPGPPLTGNGPARYYRLNQSEGTIGFIEPITEHFCTRCNRLRLTSGGKLRPCLLSDTKFDLRELLRGGASSEEIRRTIAKAAAAKPEHHRLAEGVHTSTNHNMSKIGG